MRLIVCLSLVVLLVACDRQPVTVRPAKPTSPAAPVSDPGVSGSVVETMDSGGYTYMKLKTSEGEVWAAVPQAVVKVGEEVTVTGVSPMKGFTSKTLNRTFDEILFGTLGTGADAHGMSNPHGGAPAPVVTVDLSTPIAKAEGEAGRTVAEVHAQKAELKGKTVAVRGKVVKFLTGIMGKNWLHIQDGSGKADDGSNDLTVTTSGTAAVGDLVIVRGVLGVDRDFGAGYAYSVILEDAAIEK